MAEFRWLLLAVGILLLAVVFWWSRREASGRPVRPKVPLARVIPPLAPPGSTAEPLASPHAEDPGGSQAPLPERIITVRLTARNAGTFSGEALVLALREAGLRHGRFGIFHRHDPSDETVTRFSVASLVEPGSFDLSRIKTERFPGVSLFLGLPGGGDALGAFDDMLATARRLAASLDGEVLDDSGSRLSVQRERYLREEVIRFQHRAPVT
jgi:cell division protein ZipA